MKPETIAYLLDLLDREFAQIATQRRKSKAAAERQRIYYSGIFTAINTAISEAFTKPVCIFVSHEGKHSIEP